MSERYTVVAKDRELGILCHSCGKTSYHPKDIEERYCANCHVFHDLEQELHQLIQLVHDMRQPDR